VKIANLLRTVRCARVGVAKYQKLLSFSSFLSKKLLSKSLVTAYCGLEDCEKIVFMLQDYYFHQIYILSEKLNIDIPTYPKHYFSTYQSYFSK
jgi:hypothetical protein